MPQTKQKFRSKVLIIFFLISFIPVLVIAASNLYLVIKTRQQNIVELQALAMENLGEKVTKYLAQKIEGLNLVVSGNIDSINELPANSLYFLMYNSFAHSQPNSMDFIDEKGYMVVRGQAADNFAYSRDYLDNFGEDEALFQGSDGRIKTKHDLRTFSRVEAYVGQSLDFRSALEGRSYYGPVELIGGRPVMRLATQIRNEDGDIIGVVSAEVNLDQVDILAKEATLGTQGYVYVLEETGNVIGSGNDRAARVGENLADIPRIKGFLAMPGTTEAVYADSVDGRRIITDSAVITDLGWRIICEWPIKDAFSVIGNILYGSFFVSLFILILVIVVGSYFTGKIVRPIKTLSQGAKQISEGNLEHSIKLKTNDEFEVLGEQFNEMIKVLKENRKLRDEFVFIAAHELRTPVTAIKGYVSMILEETFGPVPKDIKENLVTIQGANDRLVQLVQDLLQVARSEAGKMKIEMKEVAMGERIKGVLNELKSLSEPKGISLNYNEESTAIVRADEYKLNEVLVNIIGNAIKYTVNNGAIDISHEQKNGTLITHIKDHGIGMSKEQMEKLFTKFYRVQTDVTAKIEGTGLGLFICKEIVERMGGRIWVESEEGKGSVFSFSLKMK